MPRVLLLLAFLVVTSGCAEPPSKEMHQAQGAIDAARAAGADEYAGAELDAAVAALAQSDEAVAARDYRLALALALNSREQAQAAAKTAVDGRARARGDAERELAEAVALVERATARLATPEVAKVPRRTIAPIETAVTAAGTSLQETRALLDKEEYAQVITATTAVTAQVEQALTAIDTALLPPAKGRRR
jgi:hypothetical protein